MLFKSCLETNSSFQHGAWLSTAVHLRLELWASPLHYPQRGESVQSPWKATKRLAAPGQAEGGWEVGCSLLLHPPPLRAFAPLLPQCRSATHGAAKGALQRP